MIVVDASVLVAPFHHADRFHEQSVEWLHQHLLRDGLIMAPRLVLAKMVLPFSCHKPTSTERTVAERRNVPGARLHASLILLPRISDHQHWLMDHVWGLLVKDLVEHNAGGNGDVERVGTADHGDTHHQVAECLLLG